LIQSILSVQLLPKETLVEEALLLFQFVELFKSHDTAENDECANEILPLVHHKVVLVVSAMVQDASLDKLEGHLECECEYHDPYDARDKHR
jgi:hypothetical protein